MNHATLPHVVILGGGFAGLYAARTLERAAVRITLVDRLNHHLFQPLLYQVATASLNPSDIAAPIRSILRRQRNVTVYLAEARAIDRATKTVLLGDGNISYDYLIIATGATHSYFGNDSWEANAPGLKTLEDALEIRRRVLVAYESAERESDELARQAWLTFVVVGGGPTGVELAGALSEIARKTMGRDFRHFNPADARVILIEGTDRVLPSYPPDLSERARSQLHSLGVEIWTQRFVSHIDGVGVQISSERLPCRTVLWAAGVRASSLGSSLAIPLDKSGKVLVNRDLTVGDTAEVLVAGDLVSFEQDGRLVPGTCPAAIQQGRHAARNILRAIAGEPLAEFRYQDKGSLATIGRGAGVADFGRVHLGGPIAWMAWLFIHIFFLIGFRNRFLVMFQWAWSYLTYQRAARLITKMKTPMVDETS
ncbi:MAG TPA: NAD(P)/FAD-dependent oxidoreductase [Thermoanaerobaculia bacterium]|nr:NAD(P)/FAD-dependent oxidoreductase [Thermoanaerobaculia bacterium]